MGFAMLPIDEKESFPDFGEQFTVDNKIEGYWGSVELFKDIVHPFNPEELQGKTVMEVGSGSGRILRMLAEYGPEKIISIEPSKAIEVAKRNNAQSPVPIEFHNVRGEEIPVENEVDVCVSLGVLHHAPGADEIVKKIKSALKPGGKIVIWLYGYEGNELYLAIFNNLRRVTKLFPDGILRALSHLLNVGCRLYILGCRFVKLPMRDYMLNVFGKFNWRSQVYVIFDQLNPAYSKYYKKDEAIALIENAGLKVEAIHHRREYSWTVVGEKP